MIKAISSEIYRQFEAGLPSGFSRCKDIHPYWKSLGFRAYTRKEGRLTLILVLLRAASGRDQFAVEAGWTIHERIPQRSSLFLPAKKRSEFREDEFLFRLSMLATGKDHWYRIREASRSAQPLSAARAKKLVTPHMKAAHAMIAEHALPYFAELVKKKLRGKKPGGRKKTSVRTSSAPSGRT